MPTSATKSLAGWESTTQSLLPASLRHYKGEGMDTSVEELLLDDNDVGNGCGEYTEECERLDDEDGGEA